jgi:hypothetical protein
MPDDRLHVVILAALEVFELYSEVEFLRVSDLDVKDESSGKITNAGKSHFRSFFLSV